MTGMLFSEPNKRRPYRPKAYRSKFALENTDPAEEGLSGGEFDGDLTNDPLEDLEAHPWVAEPGAEEVVNQDEDFEREEDTLTNKAASSRRAYMGFPYDDLHNQPFIPGHKWPTYLYRGLAIKVPSDVEGELDFAMMEGDQQGVFQVGRKILDIIGRNGIGRHWTTEPDVAMDFANMNKSSGNVVVVLSALWERDGEDFATEHEGYDGVVRPSRLVGEEEVTLKPGTRIKLLSMRGSRVLNGRLMERNFDIEFLSSPEMKTAFQLVANDEVLDTLNPTGTVFTEYNPQGRASLDLAPNIAPYSETSGMSPDDRVVVYRGVPKGVQSELADGDFITDMEQLAKDYAGTGDVISQEVFADEILDDLDDPLAGEYLFRPRKTSKRAFHRRIAEDYFMEHRPAGPDYGVPLHDLNEFFPDIYDSPHYYDYGEPGNKDSFSAIQRAKGNPEEMVTMYRSIPSDGTPSFAPGDWVSTSGDYARQHSLSDNEEDDDFIVMEQQVPASSLWSEGNSVAEWGYHGDALDGTISEKYTPKKTLERLRSQKSSSRRVADKFQDSKYQPGTLYRGLSVDLLSDDEVNTLQEWAARNSFDPEDPDGFDFAEPNFEMIYPILERLEESGGLGRHWTKDYDVANEFSRGWANDDPGNQGVVLKVDWDGSGIDTEYDEATTTADGSTVGVYDEEKEVNLAPGAGANLVGIDFTDLWGNKSNIPVPNVPVYARKRGSRRVAVDSETSSPQTLYRGVRLNLDPEDSDRFRQTVDKGISGQSLEEIGSELTVGPEILDRMEEYGGLGTHWSTRPEIAERFSLQSNGNGEGVPVLLTTEWDGSGQDHDRTGAGGEWTDEAEITLLPGTPLNVNSVTFGSSFGDGYEVLNTDKYDRYTDQFTSQGLQPPKGGPQSRFANKSAGTEDRPGNIYRGIASDFLTDDEYNQIVDWTRQNRFDPDNFTMAEPNFEMIYPILERLEEKNGLGRHWSTDYDVAWDFASQNAEHYDEHYNRDEDDPDYRSPFGIVFRGDWDGEGVDYAKQHRGYDGVMRPSDLEHEKEVTLHPGSEVNLLGIDILDSAGFTYDIPVPDVPIYSKKRVAQRKRENMSAINGYLRYANLRGLDPNDSRTSRSYRRASRNLSPKSVVEINNWVKAQKVAHNTANQVLATTRSYRHKISSSWHLDNKLNAYISKVQQKFACSCGSKLAVPSYTNCKCGKVWNAYKIHSATKGDTVFVVREIPVRENVLVANKTASRRRQAQGGSWKANDNSRPYGGFDNPATYELVETLANDPYAIEQAQYAESADDLWDIGLEVMPQGFDFSSVNWKQVDEGLNDDPDRNIDKRVSRRRRSRRRHALDQNFYEEFLNFAEQQGVDFNEVDNQNEDELYRFDEAMYDFLDVNSVDDDDRIYDLMDAASSFGVYSPGGNDHLHGPYEDVPVTPPSDEDYARSRAGYPGRQSSRKRRVANDYDIWDDTYDFFDRAKGRGYTMPKDMGDPDSGTFQDELWDYTKGDRSRMERITDTARDNWDGLRHSRRTRRGRR